MGSNRTFMELKWECERELVEHGRFNRTFMELKLQVNEIVALVSR